MSDAYKCDVCGEFSDSDPQNVLQVENRKGGVPVLGDANLSPGTVELCTNCSIELKSWIRNAPRRLAAAEPRHQPDNE